MRNTILRKMYCNAPKSRQSIQLILDQEKGKGDTVGLVNKSKKKRLNFPDAYAYVSVLTFFFRIILFVNRAQVAIM